MNSFFTVAGSWFKSETMWQNFRHDSSKLNKKP